MFIYLQGRLAQIWYGHLVSRGWHLCTRRKDAVCICRDANSTALAAHGGDHSPLVGFWAVIFTRLKALIPSETSTNVDLGRKRGPLSYLAPLTFIDLETCPHYIVCRRSLRSLFFNCKTYGSVGQQNIAQCTNFVRLMVQEWGSQVTICHLKCELKGFELSNCD